MVIFSANTDSGQLNNADTMNRKTDNKLGDYLRSLRRSLKYSQGYVAAKLNILQQTYSHYETGRIIPPTQMLMTLARLYDVPVEELLSLTEPEDVTQAIVHEEEKKPIQDTPDYTAYLNEPVNLPKLRFLSESEKKLLYYYSELDEKDKRDLIRFLSIRVEDDK